MGYFRELPDLEYQVFDKNLKNSSSDYVRVKNFFRRVKLRNDLYNVTTIFVKYQIPEGARPETVAEELYGDPELDWVVIISGGITNIRDEWPLSDRVIYRYSEQKYGENLNSIKHYITKEVKDSQDRLILPAGKVVNSNFTINNPDNKGSTLNPVTAITNYEYEVEKNNKKRQIYLLKPLYLQQFINDMRVIMHYDESSQYINDLLIKTENTRVTSP